MTIRTFITLALCWYTLSPVIRAQSADWQTLVGALLRSNPEVQAAEKEVAAAEAAIRVAGTLPDPKLELSASLTPVETRNGPIENQLMLGQMFPLWGKLSRQEKIAVLKRELARENSRSVRLSIISQFESRWAQYQQIQHSLTILNRYRTELESFRNIALTQYSTGLGLTQHPILKLQIEQTRVETKTRELQAKKTAVLEALGRLFDGPVDTVMLIHLEWPELALPADSGWIGAAREFNPMLNMSRIREEISRVQRELKERQNYPDLVAGMTYTVVGPTDLPGAVSAGKDALGVKLGLNLPLWLGRNRARVESARIHEKASQISTTDTENKIEEKVAALLADLEQIRANAALYQNRLLPEADQMLSSAFAAYKTGKISFLDLLDSERMTVNLKLDYERILKDQRIREATLRQVAGIVTDEE
ncbi:MAG: TolC family protein [Candidatus Neomarinimicrobiota bacterium]|nr:MAG: TolC family protein [Candidatus Neomarinimicrobiota bacterium]